jgi:ABC-type transporter Mla subunit MlaD
MTDFNALVLARTGKTRSDLIRDLAGQSTTGGRIADQLNSAFWHLTSVEELLNQAIEQATRDLSAARARLQAGQPHTCGVLHHNMAQVHILTGRLSDARVRFNAALVLAVQVLDLDVRDAEEPVAPAGHRL